MNNYERQYEKQTIEDVRISHISKEDFSALEAEKKKKAENQPVELINVDKVSYIFMMLLKDWISSRGIRRIKRSIQFWTVSHLHQSLLQISKQNCR